MNPCSALDARFGALALAQLVKAGKGESNARWAS
jgi:hypothetical protein